MDVTQIMDALDVNQLVYQKEAVLAAMAQREDVVPPLLEVLERMLREPEKYYDPEYESLLPFYALHLLGYHRVREAHPLLIELIGLPGEVPYELFGDHLFEGLPAILWKTSGGDPADMMRLVRDRQASETGRLLAIRALGYGVAEGILERETVVELLQGLLTSDEGPPEDPTLCSAAATMLSRLWPGESMELLEKALDQGLIDEGYIGMESFKRSLQEGKEARLLAFSKWANKDLERTPHEEIRSWACFDLARPRRRGLEATGPSSRSAAKKAASANKRKRQRKQSRAARKKGRSKKKKRK